MANHKEIIRDEYIRIKLSKQEKDLWLEFAKEAGINPTRLARNVLMMEAESLINKYFTRNVSKAYIKYCKLTQNQEVLDRIKTD